MTTSLNRYTQYNYNEQSVDKTKQSNAKNSRKLHSSQKDVRYKKQFQRCFLLVPELHRQIKTLPSHL